MKQTLFLFFSVMLLISCSTTREISQNDFDYLEEDGIIESKETIQQVKAVSKLDTNLLTYNLITVPSVCLFTPIVEGATMALDISYMLVLCAVTSFYGSIAAIIEPELVFEPAINSFEKTRDEIENLNKEIEELSNKDDFEKYKKMGCIAPFCKADIIIDNFYEAETSYDKKNNTMVSNTKTITIHKEKDTEVSKKLLKLKIERICKYIECGLKAILIPITFISCTVVTVAGCLLYFYLT